MPIKQIQEYNVEVYRHQYLISAKGLTIDHAFNDGDTIGIRFTDGTVFFAYDDESANLDSLYRIDAGSLVSLGLMTKEQRDARLAAEAQQNQDRVRERERKEYERLKAIFEGPQQ